MIKTAQQWIDQLSLDAHPEGGFYKRVYASEEPIESNGIARPLCTSIHYLLNRNDYSAWHRIKSDEQWFFHDGASLTIYEINEAGTLIEHTVGPQHTLTTVIAAGSWFCAHVTPKDSADFSLVSCVVAPGFVFDEFELANADQLSAQYPEHAELIKRYCRQ